MRNPEDDKLWAYLDGALRPREHAIMKKQLMEDPNLSQRLTELRSMHELLESTMPALETNESTERVVRGVLDQLSDRPDNTSQ